MVLVPVRSSISLPPASPHETNRGAKTSAGMICMRSDTVFTLYSRLYNRLGELYANEPSQAALERSSQDAYDVIRLTRRER